MAVLLRWSPNRRGHNTPNIVDCPLMEPISLPELPSIHDFGSFNRGSIGLRPVGLQKLELSDGQQLPFLGGSHGFCNLEIFLEIGDQLAVTEVNHRSATRWADSFGCGEFGLALSALTKKRPPFSGLTSNKPIILGIINVTPDSFYAGSRIDPTNAADIACRMIEDGADIIDVGGESTRPGSNPTPPEQEMDRVIPVIERLKGCGIPLSVDTRRPAVMREAISSGVSIVNDVTALSDEDAITVLRENPKVSVVLMHAQGSPKNMQNNPQYNHVTYEVFSFLRRQVVKCQAAGIDRSRIAVDPGFGFGKNLGQNVQMLRELAMLHCIGCTLLVGVSRKSFLGAIVNEADPEGRLAASIAASIAASSQGAQIHRVHDVREISQALTLFDRVTTH